MIRVTTRRLILLTTAAIMLSSCERPVRGHATPEAATQFAEIASMVNPDILQDMDAEQMASITGLIEHFAATADAKYALPASEGAYTMLHLACYFKKPELARCLLLDGADPNARATDKDLSGGNIPGDTPLSFALTDYANQEDEEAKLLLLDVLVQGGADVSAPGPQQTPLFIIASLQSSEKVFLKLLDLGLPLQPVYTQQGESVPAAAGPAYNGWLQALKRVVETLEAQNPDTSVVEGALSYAVMGGNAQTLDCINYLLAHGANVNESDENGTTPLYNACRLYYELRHGLGALSDNAPDSCAALEEVIALLLSNGADPTIARQGDESQEFPGFCAADFLYNSPAFVERLKEAGIRLPEQAANFTSGVPLLSEICRHAINPHFKLRPQDFEAVASVLTPTQAMLQSELYDMALPKAIRLLAQQDAARTTDLIMALPMWSHPHDDHSGCNCNSHYAAIIQSLMDTPSLILPADFLKQEAQRAMQAGAANEAANLTELIYRCPNADVHLAALLDTPVLPICAGAWSAKLLVRGLPAPRSQSVKVWLREHECRASSPALQKALRLTSLDEFWYGQMPPNEVEAFLDDLGDIGATKAQGFYRELAKHLNNPTKLDEIASQVGDITYELEIATARYILEHEEDFRSASKVPLNTPSMLQPTTPIVDDTPTQPSPEEGTPQEDPAASREQEQPIPPLLPQTKQRMQQDAAPRLTAAADASLLSNCRELAMSHDLTDSQVKGYMLDIMTALKLGSDPQAEDGSGASALMYLHAKPELLQDEGLKACLKGCNIRETQPMPAGHAGLLRLLRIRRDQMLQDLPQGSRDYLQQYSITPALAPAQELLNTLLNTPTAGNLSSQDLSDCLSFLLLADRDEAIRHVAALPYWQHGEHFLESVPGTFLEVILELRWPVPPEHLKQAIAKLGTMLPASPQDMIDCNAAHPLAQLLELLVYLEGDEAANTVSPYENNCDPELAFAALLLRLHQEKLPEPHPDQLAPYLQPAQLQGEDRHKLSQLITACRMDRMIQSAQTEFMNSATLTRAAQAFRTIGATRHAELVESYLNPEQPNGLARDTADLPRAYRNLSKETPRHLAARFILNNPYLFHQEAL